MSNKGVCRTAPATPGLLNTCAPSTCNKKKILKKGDGDGFCDDYDTNDTNDNKTINNDNDNHNNNDEKDEDNNKKLLCFYSLNFFLWFL